MLEMTGFLGGPLVIQNIGGSATVNFGGALFISPKFATKSFNGAGSGHTGAINISYAGLSSTNTAVTDLFDQPIALDT
jgi:spore germination protein PF